MTGKSSAAAAALATALLAYWFTPADVSYPLPEGDLHAVAVDDGEAVVDLPFATADEQYLLVVSNLSTDVTPRTVALDSHAIGRVECVPLRRVADLGATAVSAVRSVGTTEPAASDYESVSRSRPNPRRLGEPGGSAPASVAVSESPALRTLDGTVARSFWLNVDGGGDNPASYRKIATRLAGEGRTVRVFVDCDDAVDAAVASAAIGLFDEVLQPGFARAIGQAPDVDGDGKLALVLTGWLGRMQGGTVSLGGLVQPRDFDRTLAAPLSNRADVVFLNAASRPGPHLQTLLAHEYAHAVLSGARAESKAVYEEAWLDEAIAHQAEERLGAGWSNLDYRVAAHLAAPHAAPLVVADYRAEGLWRSPAPRGHTFLFLRWCGKRYGPHLLRELIASRSTGRDNLAAATGEAFEELFRRFAADLVLREFAGDNAANGSLGAAPTLRLNEPLGDWPLAGPRRERWDVAGEDARQVVVSGTSSAYYVLSAQGVGPRRLTVRIDQGGELQVSLVRLPDDLPRLDVRVVAAQGGPSLEIIQRGGRAATIEQVAWGPVAFAPQASSAHRAVRGAELASLLGNVHLSPRGRLRSQPINFSSLPPGEVYVSVVARDGSGRRVSAWTSLDPAAAEPPLAAVAPPRVGS